MFDSSEGLVSMIRFVFEISGETCEGLFQSGDDAVIGGHARLGMDRGSRVRVGEVTDKGVDWLGQWTYDRAAVWRPERKTERSLVGSH